MCGRFTLTSSAQRVAEVFDLLPTIGQHWPIRYNVAPTQMVAAVRCQLPINTRELAWLQWGLIPAWSNDPTMGSRMINARCETLSSKPAFREAYARRRCLIVADGFYEWKQGSRSKQPHYIRRKDNELFAFAGLWEPWQQNQCGVESCTIITTEANALLRDLHQRMPVILHAADYDRWLDPTLQEPAALQDLLVPLAAHLLQRHPVGPLVNRAHYDQPDCVTPAAPPKTQGRLFD